MTDQQGTAPKLTKAQREFLTLFKPGEERSIGIPYRPATRLVDLGLLAERAGRYGGTILRLTHDGCRALEATHG